MAKLNYPKVYFMLCGTNGMEVESGLMKGVCGGRIVLCNKKGEETGWLEIESTFLTEQHARNDWRRRSKAEVAHGAQQLESCAERLVSIAKRLRKRATKCVGDWRDL